MTKIPPVVVAGAAGLAQLFVSRGARPTRGSVAAGALVAGSALALAGSALQTFRDQGTTFDPIEIDNAQTLVENGPYRFTRNPMYLGIAGFLLGAAIARRSVKAVLPVGGFVAVMTTTQIRREEAALTAIFGAPYLDYLRRVPRWVGPVERTQ